MKTHSVIYARTHKAAQKKASHKYKHTSRMVLMIHEARGSKRGNLKPFAVWTIKRKRKR